MTRDAQDADLAPERYELWERPPARLSRRGFLQAAGAGLAVFVLVDCAESQRESGVGQRRRGGQRVPAEVGAWLHVGEDGVVTAYTGKAEVGQDIRTSLTQAVADELRLPVSSVRLVMGDTAVCPFDMGTFGSRTTPDMAVRLRRAAAAAREMLIDMAAAEWQAPRDSLEARQGAIHHPATGRSAPFAGLTKGRRLAGAISEQTAPTPPALWREAGRSVQKIDAAAFVTGSHKYASDIRRPGMLHGRILRPETAKARLKSVDLRRAEGVPGVKVVREGDFVGVAAPDVHTAARALEAIQAEWEPEAIPPASRLFEHLRATAEKRGPAEEAESLERALASGHKTLRQTYTVAYIAHAPLEPRAAVAEWEGDQLTVWTGTQRPFGVRQELASAFGLREERVRVIVPDTGAGYGGKHTGEAALEAARLARAAGKPVKVVWTREEEFTRAYFRPGGVIDAASAANADGILTAWEFHNYNSGGSAPRTPYAVPLRREEFHGAQSPFRQGSYRALAATANHFARETHMDEMAAALGLDPLEFRRRNLKDDRIRAVLDAAAERFGWGRPLPAGHGAGVACGTEKGSVVATCAQVRLDGPGREVKVVRAVTAFECGAIVNPDHLRNQVEGCVIMGIGGALWERIEHDERAVLNPRFSRYRVPRFGDCPALETVLLDRKDLPPAGAGETPIVCIAPAIGNALFAATGLRLRSMPLAPRGLSSGA